ncbi:LacI family DNA-binding transcriptional regulator [Ruania albidiflava]|uniref:LacI family DNA-binding transcriptional regulator n=1 Tax=Ruania albidiflava TaxID=366586 RepID=UPI0003B41E0A|nr:LacI family DNA-binding transcriptional regulator [Ruania albidiflava]
MRDVAGRAGVSVKTVSRVVNGEPHIRPETRQLVHAAITELAWVPNAAARTLRTGRTGVVAIAVTELRRPALALITEALVREVDGHGLHAAVEPTHDDPARIEDILARIGRTFDGVLMVRPPELAVPLPDDVALVVVDGSPGAALGEGVSVEGSGTDEMAAFDRVSCDLEEIAALITRHLAVMSRHRPVLIGHPRAAEHVLRQRLRGAGLDPDAPMVPINPANARSGGYQAAQRVLAECGATDALVCADDEIAMGALSGLAHAGISVPDRVAVIGCGNLDDGQFSTPSLTTVDLGVERMARTAADLLVARLAGGPPQPPVTCPVALVRRESTLGGNQQ